MVLYQNLLDSIMEKLPIDAADYLQQIADISIVLYGQGHSYNEGSYEFPLNNFVNMSALITCFKMTDIEAEDSRLRNGYFQYVIFIPLEYLQFLPSFMILDKAMRPIITRYKLKFQLTENAFFEMQKQISKMIMEIIRRNQTINMKS